MSKDVQVVLDHSAINQVGRYSDKALLATAEKLQDEIRNAQVIPRMDGTLSGEAFVIEDLTQFKGYVRMWFQTPYARRLYFHPEYKFHHEPWEDSKGKHDGNPNAQGMWLKPWIDGRFSGRPKLIYRRMLERGL